MIFVFLAFTIISVIVFYCVGYLNIGSMVHYPHIISRQSYLRILTTEKLLFL